MDQPVLRPVGIALLVSTLLFTSGCERFFKELAGSKDFQQSLQKIFGGDKNYREGNFFSFEKRGSITGKVVDSQGAGIQYATVLVDTGGESIVAHTDKNGNYTIMGIPAAEGPPDRSSVASALSTSALSVRATRTGYQPGAASIPSVGPGFDNLVNTITLKADQGSSNLGTVRVTVVDDKSDTRLFAKVYLVGSETTQTTNTDISGVAILQSVTLGKATVKCEGGGTTAQKEILVTAATPGAITEAELRISTNQSTYRYDIYGDIEGQVKDKMGQPVFNARVYAQGFADQYGSACGVPTDHDGRFWLHGIPQGTQTLRIEVNFAGSSTTKTTQISIKGGYQNIGTITLDDFDFQTANTGKGRLNGEVWSGNQQLGGAKLTLKVDGRSETYTVTSLDSNGRFRFKDVVCSMFGSYYTLTAEKEGYGTYTYKSEDNFERIYPQQTWDTGDGMWVRIEVRRKNDKGEDLKVLVSGHIWKRGGGNVGGVLVELVDPKTSTKVDSNTTSSDGDIGRFTLAAATGGTYTIRATLSGYQTLEKQVNLTLGSQDISGELRPLISVSGEVKSSSTGPGGGGGSALSGVNVTLTATDSDLSGTKFTATSGSDGKFTISSMPEGNYALSLSKAGYTFPGQQYYVSSTLTGMGTLYMEFGSSGSPNSYWPDQLHARVVTTATDTYVLVSMKLNSNLGEVFNKTGDKTIGLFKEKLSLVAPGGSTELPMEYNNELWTGTVDVTPGVANAPWGFLYKDVGSGIASIKLKVDGVEYSLSNNSVIIPQPLTKVSSIRATGSQGQTTYVSWGAVTGGSFYNVVVQDTSGRTLGSTFKDQNWMPSSDSNVTLNWTALKLAEGQPYQVVVEAQNQWGNEYTRKSVSAPVSFTYYK